jgi:hypothetical protein
MMGPIFRRELATTIKSRLLLLFAAIMLASLIPNFLEMRDSVVGMISQAGDWQEIQPVLERSLGFTLWLYSFLVLMLITVIFGFNALVVEKAKGVTESLLVALPRVEPLWWGKTLGVFLPAYVINLIITLLMVAVFNLWMIVPAGGQMILPWASLITSLVTLPFMLLALVFLLMFLALIISNSQIVSIAAILLMVGMSQVLSRTSIEVNSWNFTWLHLGAGIVIALITVFLGRSYATKERIVLSAKAAR